MNIQEQKNELYNSLIKTYTKIGRPIPDFVDKYHVTNCNDNLEHPLEGDHLHEYQKGGGSEFVDSKKSGSIIPAKMKSIRSSSAFSYNMFGPRSCIEMKANKMRLPIGKYSLKYEEKLGTLKEGGKANIDVHLFNKKCDIYIEMKLLEPLEFYYNGKSFNSYQNKERYYSEEAYQTFAHLFDDFHNEKNGKHKPKGFDVCQMLKHSLGIYNDIIKTINDSCYKPVTKSKNVFIVNCHWEPNNNSKYSSIIKNRLKNSLAEYEDCFPELEKAFETIGANVKFLDLTHLEMLEAIQNTSSYMDRYII